MVQLRKYQIEKAALLISRKRVYLVSDMGSGKTAIAISAMQQVAWSAKPFLVLAPKLVASQVWLAETKLWGRSHFQLVPLLGPPQSRLDALKEPADAYVINYELAPWLAEQISIKGRFNGLILDEISRFKKPNKKRWKAILPLADTAEYVWGLTGTPLSTGLLDLFGQFRMIDKGASLGKYITHYKQEYFTATDPNGWTWKPQRGAEQLIYDRIRDSTLHITRYDQLEVAKTFTNEIKIQLEDKARKQYKELYNEFLLTIENEEVITAENAAIRTNKLSQFTGGGLYNEHLLYKLIHTAKIDALEEVLDNLEGRPALIVYNYRGEANAIIKRRPEGYWLGGNLNMSDAMLLDRWCEGKLPYLLIHTANAGHGLNLQSGGHHIVWFAGTWSQESYRQTNARLARSGQQYPVYIHHLLVQNSIDTIQYKVMLGRMQQQDNLIEEM